MENTFKMRLLQKAHIFTDKRCCICKNILADKKLICGKCLKAFVLKEVKCCPICLHPIYDEENCPSCRQLEQIHFDSLKIIQYYYSFCKTLVMYNKKRGDSSVIKIYYEILKNAGILDKNIVIVTVPDNSVKKIKKGRSAFSSISDILKKEGYMINKSIIAKKFFTGKQKMRNREERVNKSASDFYLLKNRQSVPSKVILLDDIYTTGSTINQCAKLLKLSGVEEVHAVTLFRAFRKTRLLQ